VYEFSALKQAKTSDKFNDINKNINKPKAKTKTKAKNTKTNANIDRSTFRLTD